MAVVCTTRRIEGIRSIIGGGALSEDLVLELSGDENNPGQLYYYGTNSSGRKGWHALPENISDLVGLENRVASLENRMTAAESLIQTNITDIAALDVRITALEAWRAVDGVSWAITAVSYSVASGINHVKCTASGITITLPVATSVRKITVKNQTDGSVTVTSASLIDSANSWLLAGREAGQFVADGTIWNIV
jgi:hypothetical protein